MSTKEEAQQTENPDNWQAVVMLPIHKSDAAGQPVPASLDSPHAEVIPVPAPLSLIVSIASDRIALEKDLRSEAAKQIVLRSLKGVVLERYGGTEHVPTLHPIRDFKITKKSVKKAVKKLEEIQSKLQRNAMYHKEQEGDFKMLKALAEERVGLQVALQRSQLTDFRDEVQRRRRVLRRLGHLTGTGMLSAKGKAAAEACALLYVCLLSAAFSFLRFFGF
jgi:superfamily II RNA helicase